MDAHSGASRPGIPMGCRPPMLSKLCPALLRSERWSAPIEFRLDSVAEIIGLRSSFKMENFLAQLFRSYIATPE